jgi:hypothetical protein
MTAKIFLFTWPDTYSLNQELQFWANSFKQKFGEDSVDTYNSENRNEAKINQSIFGWWLFVTHKMTIIKWLPASGEKGTWLNGDLTWWFTENFMKNYNQIPNENIIIFVSQKPDWRWKFFKFFQNEYCTIKEFKPISGIQLKSLVKQKFENIKISDSDISFFIDYIGTDLYQITSEIDKLREYCLVHDIHEISRDLIEKVSFWITENKVFEFLNLAFKDTKKAIEYLQKIQEDETHWIEFAGAIYSQLKSCIMINRFYQAWIKDSKEIASQCGLNPMSVLVNLKNIKEISKNWIELENMYKQLIQTDINIKSWINTETEFRLNTKKMVTYFKN